MKSLVRHLAAKLFVWWTVHELRRSFTWAASLPHGEAMLVITRWRWQMLRSDAVDEEIREHYLLALDRLERIVKEHRAELAQAA